MYTRLLHELWLSEDPVRGLSVLGARAGLRNASPTAAVRLIGP